MNLQNIIKSCLCLFMITIAFGCGEKARSSINPDKVEAKQPAENYSTHIREADSVLINTSETELSRFVPPVWHKELAHAFYLVFK